MSPPEPVGFYPAFSPVPHSEYIGTRWLFSVTLLQTFACLPVKKHGALRCPDFPPLPVAQEKRQSGLRAAKVTNFLVGQPENRCRMLATERIYFCVGQR